MAETKDLRFIQITPASFSVSAGQHGPYGLTEEGTVYCYSPHEQGWWALSMADIEKAKAEAK